MPLFDGDTNGWETPNVTVIDEVVRFKPDVAYWGHVAVVDRVFLGVLSVGEVRLGAAERALCTVAVVVRANCTDGNAIVWDTSGVTTDACACNVVACASLF